MPWHAVRATLPQGQPHEMVRLFSGWDCGGLYKAQQLIKPILYLCSNQSLCRLPLRAVSVHFVRLEIV